MEGQKENSIFTCRKCRRYLITSESSALRPIPADLVAISLAHFDIILHEKNYRPVAECLWNNLQS